MFGTLLALLASTAAASAGADELRLEGRCEYSEAVRKYQHEAVLTLCNTLAIGRGGDGTTFDFGQRSWGSMMQFHGLMSGERMKISHVTLRNGKSVDVEGTCQIFYTNDQVSVVSCLARARAQTYVANFVPNRVS